ncbi:hypothetical protein AABB24_002790 [Solanum stoloniferum]|uniref:Uncharacterized protein n=1 Tax=Solanum stoloniferum TaxID=62892 RepID=A0ABD2V4E2_9SOLN
MATSSDTLQRKACEEMSCNQPNKLSRTEEQTLKEPPSVNIQENASNQIRTSTCSSNKAKQLFPPFYAFEKGTTSNTCKGNKMSFLRSFISRVQHPTHVRNNKMSLLKLLQRKVISPTEQILEMTSNYSRQRMNLKLF